MVDFLDWGMIDYERALKRQLVLIDLVHRNEVPEQVVFCQHPPVVTKGRATKDKDFLGWQGNVVEVTRGGRLTYHGPNQIVIYPILKLGGHTRVFAQNDIRAYLDFLLGVSADILREFGVDGYIRKDDPKDEDGDSVLATGVWIKSQNGEDQKLASVGIAVSHWISYHGIAINVLKDEKAFQGIRPCGFTTETMTSIEAVTGKKHSYEEVSARARSLIAKRLNP